MYGGAEKPDILSLGLAGTLEKERPSLLGFYKPTAVYDPKDPSGETLLPAPRNADEWVTWYREHPYLDAEAPVPATLGGVSGTRIASVVSDVPKGASSLPLWTVGDKQTIGDEKGARSRTIILEVEGETLLVDVSAADNDSFEQLLPKAQRALDNVSWGAG